MIKIIAIGNLLMGDDGIALKVVDLIKEKVSNNNLDIECIKAETDFDYALDNIKDGDYIYILDSTLLGLEYGQISKIPIEESEMFSFNELSVHSVNLLTLIKHYNLNVSGYIIGIEVADVSFSLNISNELKIRFERICSEVFENICIV